MVNKLLLKRQFPIVEAALFVSCSGEERKKRPCNGLKKDKFYLSFCGALQNAVIARH